MKVYMKYIIARTFVKKVVECQGTPALRRVLENICQLFLVHDLSQNSGDLLEVPSYKKCFDAILRV